MGHIHKMCYEPKIRHRKYQIVFMDDGGGRENFDNIDIFKSGDGSPARVLHRQQFTIFYK